MKLLVYNMNMQIVYKIENYEKMLISLFTNGGFWISRYEIGDATATKNNTNSSGIDGTPVCRADQIPYNNITCSEGQILAESMKSDANKITSIVFGIQWKHIDTKVGSIITTLDCTSWGNYSKSSLKLNRGKYNIQ